MRGRKEKREARKLRLTLERVQRLRVRFNIRFFHTTPGHRTHAPRRHTHSVHSTNARAPGSPCLSNISQRAACLRLAAGGCPSAHEGALLKAADLHADGPRIGRRGRLGDLLHVVHVERPGAPTRPAIFGTVCSARGPCAPTYCQDGIFILNFTFIKTSPQIS